MPVIKIKHLHILQCVAQAGLFVVVCLSCKWSHRALFHNSNVKGGVNVGHIQFHIEYS